MKPRCDAQNASASRLELHSGESGRCSSILEVALRVELLCHEYRPHLVLQQRPLGWVREVGTLDDQAYRQARTGRCRRPRMRAALAASSSRGELEERVRTLTTVCMPCVRSVASISLIASHRNVAKSASRSGASTPVSRASMKAFAQCARRAQSRPSR